MGIKGRGRHEPNKPRVSQELFHEKIHRMIWDFLKEVCYIESSDVSLNFKYSSTESLSLYRYLFLLAPALVISSGLPLSIYGLGSFKLVKAKNGKKKLKFRVSSSINNYLNNISWVKYGDSSREVLEDLLRIGKSNDTSLEEASNEY